MIYMTRGAEEKWPCLGAAEPGPAPQDFTLRPASISNNVAAKPAKHCVSSPRSSWGQQSMHYKSRGCCNMFHHVNAEGVRQL